MQFWVDFTTEFNLLLVQITQNSEMNGFNAYLFFDTVTKIYHKTK